MKGINKINRQTITGLSRIIWLVLLVLASGCQKTDKTNNPPTPTMTLKPLPEASAVPQVSIHFIDTGNSDAVLIKQGDQAALIDGGDNDDERLVVEYIEQQGVTKLNYVFATHPDADHIGGLDAVLTEVEVDQVLVGNGQAESQTYTDFIDAIMNRGLSPSVPLLGATFPLGGATLQVMSVANEKDVNNCSLVLLYTYGKTKVMFMGDADQSIEQQIDVNQVGDVHLIKVGHHGSKTSSNKAFLQSISPEYAVITCGKDNKHNHPHLETLETLHTLGIAIYRTDQLGNIIFEVSKEGVLPAEAYTVDEEKVGTVKSEMGVVEESRENKEEAIEAFKSLEDVTEEVVYFTTSGKRYHRDADCSNMKKPIIGTIEEAGHRTPCQKCCK